MARRTLGAIVILFLLLFAQLCPADGMYMSKEGEVDLTVPDQRAILVWGQGVETLFVESSLRAKPGQYSWIIPLPAPPTKIDKVRPSVMDVVFNQFEPTIHREPTMERDGAAKILFAVVLCIGSVLYWRGGSRTGRLLLLALFPLLVVCFLPVYAGTSKSAGGADGQLEVLERQRIGSYEVGVVKSTDAKALEQWLDQAGTPLPSKARPIVEDYIAKGWCFMAARFRKDAESAAKPHPIRIQFPTEKPVYPMRLTGLVTDKLELDMVVIGPQEAAGTPLTFMRRDEVQNNAPTLMNFTPARYAKHAEIRHVDIANFLPQEAIGTRLRGTVGRDQMQQDYVIAWREGVSPQPEFYTKEGAPILGQAVGLGAAAFFMWVGMGIALFKRPDGFRRPIFTMLVIVAAAGAVGAFVAWRTPTVEVTEGNGRPSRDMYAVSDKIKWAVEWAQNPGPGTFVERFRKELREDLKIGKRLTPEQRQSFDSLENGNAPGYKITKVGKGIYEVEILDGWGCLERMTVRAPDE